MGRHNQHNKHNKKYFKPLPRDEAENNLSVKQHLDLKSRARVEMLAKQFLPDFDSQVNAEINSCSSKQLVKDEKLSTRDLKNLLWSSVDNKESRDLDQIEYVEKLSDGNFRLLIGIADVDFYVKKGSAIDEHAFTNATSVYTGVVTYPMLPDQLSYDLSSLLNDQERLAVVTEMIVDKDGNVSVKDVYSAFVNNHAKLAYNETGNWLQSENIGEPPSSISAVPGLAEQLTLQNQVAQLMHKVRKKHGALHLETIEARPVLVNEQVVDIELVEENPARLVIENFMIASNIAVSSFLESKQVASIRRVVKTPERWERIIAVAKELGYELPANPDAEALSDFLLKQEEDDLEHFPDLSLTIVKLLGPGEYVLHLPGSESDGHFALAVHNYTHATAPNRRYADLIMQRLIKSAITSSSVPYSNDELSAIARQCTECESKAKKVERTMRKVAAAELLEKHIGEKFDGIVTGVTDGAVYVRLMKPPAEGRVVQGEKGLDVGDKVHLRLVAVDIDQAYIDFARIK